MKLGGGLRPPSETSPQDSIARAEPARGTKPPLEAVNPVFGVGKFGFDTGLPRDSRSAEYNRNGMNEQRDRAFNESVGSSFIDLLRRDSPHMLPGAGAAGETRLEIPHGTTVLAIRYRDGVVMAGDRQATAGYQVASRRIDKIFKCDELSGIGIAGAAGPAMEMAKLFQTELEHYEKVEGDNLSLEGKANKLGQMIRMNLPAAMQGLAVVPIFAGFDEKAGVGRLFKYDITGGRYEESNYDAQGSGSKDARDSLKKLWRKDMSREDSLRVALEALFDAADEDIGTGGADVIRGIYPTVRVISRSGFIDVAEEEVRRVCEAVLKDRTKSEQGV
jgi:proteasome beta subunit